MEQDKGDCAEAPIPESVALTPGPSIRVLRARYAQALEQLGQMRDHNHRNRNLGSLHPDALAPPDEILASGGFVPRVDVDATDVEAFNRGFCRAQRPALLLGAARDWRAGQRWSSKEELCRHYGDLLFKVALIGAPGVQTKGTRVELPLRLYAEYAEAGGADFPFYIFERDLSGQRAPLLEDYSPPKYFQDDLYELTDFTRSFLPEYRYYLIGVERTGSNLHVDPCGTSAWNTLFCGLKRWVLFPPGNSPEYRERIGASSRSMGMDGGAKPPAYWWLDVLPKLRESGAAEELGMIEFVQRPGETVYIPFGWWHGVLNIGFTVAVTQNLVAPESMAYVWPELAAQYPEFAPRFAQLVRDLRPEVELPAEALAAATAADGLFGSKGHSPNPSQPVAAFEVDCTVALQCSVVLPSFGNPAVLQRESDLAEMVRGIHDKAREAMKKGDYREAEEFCSAALSQLEDANAIGAVCGSLDASIRVDRAQVAMRLAHFADALADCEALEGEKPPRLAYATLKVRHEGLRLQAVALQALGRGKEAMVALRRAEDCRPAPKRSLGGKAKGKDGSSGGKAKGKGKGKSKCREGGKARSKPLDTEAQAAEKEEQENHTDGEDPAAAEVAVQDEGTGGSEKSLTGLLSQVRRAMKLADAASKPAEQGQVPVSEFLELVARGSQEGSTAEVQYFLRDWQCRVDAQDPGESTLWQRHWNALRLALESGDGEMVEVLLEFRADIRQRYDRAATPLILAARQRRPQICAALLQARADLHAQDADGMTALVAAIAAKDRIGRQLVVSDDTGAVETVTLLLEQRADANHQAWDGQTPLLLAAMVNDWPLAAQLLDHGARFGTYCHSLGFSACAMAQRGSSDSECAQRLRAAAEQDTETWPREASSLAAEAWFRLMDDLRPGERWRAKASEVQNAELAVSRLFRACDFENVDHDEVCEEGTNPLAALHQSIVEDKLPQAMGKLWKDASEATEQDVMTLMVATNRKPLVLHGDTGLVGANCSSYRDFIFHPLTRTYSFGVPSEAALACISKYSPIVEMGAGSGYWASLLTARGCDVIPYDLKPAVAADGGSTNPYFVTSFAEVRRGGPEALAGFSDRALLLCWPFAENSAGSTRNGDWDAECLAHYEGDIVIYIGEWAGQSAFPGIGMNSSLAFQRRLQVEFDCVERVQLPNWLHMCDDLSVWRRIFSLR